MGTTDFLQPRARQPTWCRITLWVASLLLIAIVATGAHAQVNPGDILVLDRDNFAGGKGLFSVNPASGSRSIISDWNNAAQDPELPDDAARSFILSDVAVSASGDIVVLDGRSNQSGTTSTPVLFRVNSSNGNRTIISNFRDAAQGIVGFPDSVAFDGEEILVLGSFDFQDALVHVDPESGFRTLIVDFEGIIGPGMGSPGFEGIQTEDSLTVDPAGNVFILDVADFFQGGRFVTSKLYKVDPTITKPPFAGRILLSDFGDPNQGELGRPHGMAVDASRNLWVTASQGALPVRQVLFKVDPNTGTRTLVATDLAVPCAPDPAVLRLTVDASGNILLAAEKVVGQDPGILFSFNPTTGVCTKVTDFAVRAQGELGERLGAVAVTPTLPAQPVDLTIANIEITQAIQNFANDVRLVQDKTTYVRVYPKVDMADRRVGARLRGFRGGAELPGSPLRPLYPLANVHTGGAARATLNDSFNFWVPPAWRSGNVSFQAEINFGGAIPETDASNNAFSLPKEFTPKAPVCVVMIPVRTLGSRYTVDSPGFDSIITRFGSLWPVPEVGVYFQSKPVEELQARFGIPPFEYGPYEMTEGFSVLNGPADKNKVIISLIARATFTDDPDECDDRNARTHYVGMVSPDTNTGTLNGLGNYVFAASWVKMEMDPVQPFATPPGGVTMAHELSHNYNGIPTTFNDRWLHVNCGGPDDTNDFYPYSPNTLGPLGNDTFWGFDPITRAIINPDWTIQPGGAADYMSYCHPRWVSDYTWEGMFNEINTLSRARVQSLETVNEPAALTQSAEILVLGGVINPTENVASFDFAYRLAQDVMSARKLEKLQSSLHSLNVSAATYILELVDTRGAVIFSQPFDSTGSYEDDPGEVFFLTVLFDPRTAHIRITGNGQELGTLTVSAHAPRVTLLQPIGGETIADGLTIQWEASDQDNDPLLYTVQYSADLGVSWQSLVTQTPETTLTLEDTFSLPGSNQQALIRVIANDGVNTGSDTSNPFTVQPHLPIAHIDTPSDQAIFALNSQIILMGRVRDAEDGPLDDEALKWLVNGEVVGVGKEAAVGGLAVGTYDVTLKAVDRDGNAATAGVTITVADTPVASPDGYTTPANTPLTVEAPGVLNNDTDPEADPLSAVLVSDVSNGSLTLNADGSFTYTPNAAFSGADSFTYKANDGTADSNVVTVSLTIRRPTAVSLDPSTATNPLGTDHTVTATVLDGSGNAVAGQVVEFRVSGTNSTRGTDTTNDVGQATFTYTGTGVRDDGSPGADTITAWVDVDGNAAQDPTEPTAVATKTWVFGE